LEPAPPVACLGERRGEDVQCDVSPQFLVPRPVDLSHSAGSEKRQNLVISQTRPGEIRAGRFRLPGPAHRLPTVCVVEPREKRRKVIGTVPIRTSSPSPRRAGDWSFLPRRNVPFLLPRSSSVALSPATRIRAWCRDTLWTSIQATARGSRPRRFSPSPRAISRSPQISL